MPGLYAIASVTMLLNILNPCFQVDNFSIPILLLKFIGTSVILPEEAISVALSEELTIYNKQIIDAERIIILLKYDK